MPNVYTEQGIIALAGVLRSGLADKMAVEISHVFVSMWRFILENGDLIKRVAELQSRQISFENETALKFDALFFLRRRKVIPQADDFLRWAVDDFFSSLFEKADTSILLIGPYSPGLHLAYENFTFFNFAIIE